MAERSAKQLGLSKSMLPHSIVEVLATLNRAGFESYIVGGGVRDSLLGLNPKDFDAVTDAKPYEVKDVFGKRCRIIGRRFQLAHVYSGRDMIEVATFRAPPKDDSHTTEDGMLMRDNVWGDILQDFTRRDFSINALYYQPLKGVVHDFCNALEDIRCKTLRLLGHAPKRIEEDPVRLLRALRFKAKLGFEFNQELAEQFHDDNWALLAQVSPHRLYDETQKMFTGGYLVPLLPLLFDYGAIKHLIVYPPNKPSALVKQVAINTDKRIAQGKSINPAFFYASLLWDNYLYNLNKLKKQNTPFVEAQQLAALKVIDRQRQKTAIPKFAEQFITDIWLLQSRLANPKAKQLLQLSLHPRFRAAFDFLLLREQCGDEFNPLSESTNGMGVWWQNFQTLNDKQKQKAIEQFATNSRRSGRQRQRDVQLVDDDNSQQPVNEVKHSFSGRCQQDLKEKAQLKQLSLSDNQGKQGKRPSPLFVVQTAKHAEDTVKHFEDVVQNFENAENGTKEDNAKVDSQSLSEDKQEFLTAVQTHDIQDFEFIPPSEFVPEKRQRRHKEKPCIDEDKAEPSVDLFPPKLLVKPADTLSESQSLQAFGFIETSGFVPEKRRRRVANS